MKKKHTKNIFSRLLMTIQFACDTRMSPYVIVQMEKKKYMRNIEGAIE